MARTLKTPAQKAEQPIRIVTRQIDKAREAIAHQQELVKTYEAQLAEHTRRLTYLAANPDLDSTVVEELEELGYLSTTAAERG